MSSSEAPPPRPKPKASGPGGKNLKPGILLRALPERIAAWRAAATRVGMTFTDWAGELLDREARRTTPKDHPSEG